MKERLNKSDIEALEIVGSFDVIFDLNNFANTIAPLIGLSHAQLVGALNLGKDPEYHTYIRDQAATYVRLENSFKASDKSSDDYQNNLNNWELFQKNLIKEIRLETGIKINPKKLSELGNKEFEAINRKVLVMELASLFKNEYNPETREHGSSLKTLIKHLKSAIPDNEVQESTLLKTDYWYLSEIFIRIFIKPDEALGKSFFTGWVKSLLAKVFDSSLTTSLGLNQQNTQTHSQTENED